jgi:hypothetical protein
MSIQPPTPLDGQTYPKFPDNWYSDATPSRPFYIFPVFPPPQALVYSPPPQTSPPYGGATHYPFSTPSFALGSPTFAPPMLTTHS